MTGSDRHEDHNVVSYLCTHARDRSDHTAFLFLDREALASGELQHSSISYGAFADRAGRLAAGVRELGVRSGDRIVVFVPLSVELYLSIAALQYVGAIPVLLDSFTREEQLVGIVENATPRGIIAPGSWLGDRAVQLDRLGFEIKISLGGSDGGDGMYAFTDLFRDKPLSCIPVSGDDTALLTYTTGSSGTPKGVNRTHGFLSEQHAALKRLFPYAADAIDLPVFPVFALNNIASGITTVLPHAGSPARGHTHVSQLIAQITSCGVTTMTLSPPSFTGLARHCKEQHKELSRLDRVLTGGAPISEHDVALFKEIAPRSQNWVLYGSTEVEPISTIEACDMLATKVDIKNGASDIGVNVGRIDSELRFAFIDISCGDQSGVVDVAGLEVPRGAIGELIVAGNHVCSGYYRNEAAFNRVKLVDREGVVWHRTGDLARLDTEGLLWIVGRKHNVIERDGTLFFPVRPEIMLKESNAGITNAAYVACEQPHASPEIIAVITVAQEAQHEYEGICDAIRRQFADAGLPLDRIIQMEHIPMDVRHHSKVDYQALRSLVYAARD